MHTGILGAGQQHVTLKRNSKKERINNVKTWNES